jgi:hypothetical protein
MGVEQGVELGNSADHTNSIGNVNAVEQQLVVATLYN